MFFSRQKLFDNSDKNNAPDKKVSRTLQHCADKNGFRPTKLKSHLLLLHNGSNIFVRDFCQRFLPSALKDGWPGGPRALQLLRLGALGIQRLRGRPRLAAREARANGAYVAAAAARSRPDSQATARPREPRRMRVPDAPAARPPRAVGAALRSPGRARASGSGSLER